MNEDKTAHLAYLTEPEPGTYLLNLVCDGEDFYRVKISRDQLINIAAGGIGIVLNLVKP